MARELDRECLHAMQVRGPKAGQFRAGCPANQSSPSDRGCPLYTARPRSLWHANGTAGKNDDGRT
jgi:hypothetical protein